MVGGSGLSGSSDLAAPEAAELGGLDGVAGHWEFEQLGLDITAVGKVDVRWRM